MLALSVYESQICECGFHESLTDPAVNFYQAEFKVCPVCAGANRVARHQHEADTAQVKAQYGAPEKVPASAQLPGDGRRLFMRPMSSAEIEKTKAVPHGR